MKLAASDTRAGLLGAWTVHCHPNENGNFGGGGDKAFSCKSAILAGSGNFFILGGGVKVLNHKSEVLAQNGQV